MRDKLNKYLPDIIIILVILTVSFLLRACASGGRQVLSDPDSYFYLRQARTGLEENWSLSQWMNYHRYYDPLIGNFNSTEVGGVTPMFHAWLLASFCRLFSIGSDSMEQAAYWFSPVIAGLACIPVYCYLKKRCGRYGAAAGASVLVLAPIYLTRTWPGYFDTDTMLAVLPIAAIMLMAEAIQEEKLKKQIWYAFSAAVMMALLSLTWGAYTQYWAGSMFLGVIAVILCAFLKKGKTALRGLGIYVLIMNATVILTTGEYYKYALDVFLPGSMLGITAGTVREGIWASNSIFVGEWAKIPVISNITGIFAANTVSEFGLLGGGAVVIAGAIGAVFLAASYIRNLRKKDSLYANCSGSSLAATAGVLIPWSAITLFLVLPMGYRFAYMTLLPLAMLAGFGIGGLCERIAKWNKDSYALPALLWMICALVVFVSMLSVSVLYALLFALFVIGLYFLEEYRLAEKNGRKILCICLSASLAFPSAVCALQSRLGNQPLANEAEQAATDWIKDNTEEDAIIASWWDNGYYYQYEARRKTIGDGGQFDGWYFTQLASALMAEDPKDSATGLRELSGREDSPIYLILTPEQIKRIQVIAYYALWDSETGTTAVPEELDATKYTMTRLYFSDGEGQTVFTKVYESTDPDNDGMPISIWKIN